MLRAYLRFWLRPTVANWRSLRRIAMKRLPAKEQKAAAQ